MSNYSEKLLDTRWQKKRLEILSRDEFTCKMCGDSEETLHVHHIAYKSYNPWETENNLLITLCKSCHEIEDKVFKEKSKALIEIIKYRGITSVGMDGLIKIFSTKVDRGWTECEPIYDLIKFAIEDDEAWDFLERLHIRRWIERRERNGS